MWKVFENIIGMFVYAAVYVVIVMIALKVVGATLSPNADGKISEEGNVGLAIVFGSLLIGLAILLASVVR
jgi:uncharacterized membrane protein YjfL (UPF0719 family)